MVRVRVWCRRCGLCMDRDVKYPEADDLCAHAVAGSGGSCECGAVRFGASFANLHLRGKATIEATLDGEGTVEIYG